MNRLETGVLDCRGRQLDLRIPQVMGILNVTPDSFSDGGDFSDIDAALSQAKKMIADGAAIIDVGGESTRPGAAPVSADQELQRVIPVIEALRAELAIPISIDTSKPVVMQAAVAAGAGFINDVRALSEPGALDMAAGLNVPVCLMHMQGAPRTMQDAPSYQDVCAEVLGFLRNRMQACLNAGIPRQHILLDPGMGFGKSLDQNLTLFHHLTKLCAIGQPLLVGVSRKSMIGAVLDVPVTERLSGGLALAALAVWQGTRLIRTHDVRETVEAVRMIAAVQDVRGQQ